MLQDGEGCPDGDHGRLCTEGFLPGKGAMQGPLLEASGKSCWADTGYAGTGIPEAFPGYDTRISGALGHVDSRHTIVTSVLSDGPVAATVGGQ